MTEKPLAEKRPTGINKSNAAAEGAPAAPIGSPSELRVNVDQLLDNPDQPRKYVDPNYIAELATTIRLHGLLFKPTARLVDGKYQLIAGHCRRDAVKLIRDQATDPVERLRWSTIPVSLVEMTDEQSAIAALIENIQREDLSAAEEGEAYARLQEKYGFATAKALAERLGVDEQRVARRVRIHQGPQALKDALTRGVKIAPLHESGSRRHEVRKLSFEGANELLRLHLFFLKKYPGVEGGKANPRTCADVKLEPVIERALAQGWSKLKIRAYVDQSVAGRAKEDDPGAQDEKGQAAAIVECKRDRLVLHLDRLGRADTAARAAAFEALKSAFEATTKVSRPPASPAKLV